METNRSLGDAESSHEVNEGINYHHSIAHMQRTKAGLDNEAIYKIITGTDK